MRQSPVKRSTTLASRKQPTNEMQETNMFRANMANLLNVQDPYAEKPRANFYSVVKHLRESMDGYKHALVVVKMNEFEARGDLEAEVRKLYTKFELEGEKLVGKYVMGLIVVVGHYHIALLESQHSQTLDAVISGLKQTIDTTSLYDQGWMLHYTEEVTKEHFRDFMVKAINAQTAAKEIKGMAQVERIMHLYGSLSEMGSQSVHMELQGKTAQTIQTYLKSQAQDVIPSGDELITALGKDDSLTLAEWAEFSDAPDIILEKEVVWPCDPELVY